MYTELSIERYTPCQYLTNDGWEDGFFNMEVTIYGQKFYRVWDKHGSTTTLLPWKVRLPLK